MLLFGLQKMSLLREKCHSSLQYTFHPHYRKDIAHCMEPPNYGHIGTSHFVLCKEVVLSDLWGLKMYLYYGKVKIWDLEKLPLQRGYFCCLLYLEGPLSEVPLYNIQAVLISVHIL